MGDDKRVCAIVTLSVRLGIVVDFLAKTPLGATSLAYLMLLEMARAYGISVRSSAYLREWFSVVAASTLYTIMMTLITALFSSIPWATAFTLYGLQLLQWIFVLILFSFVCYPLLRQGMRWLVATLESRRSI